jgi:PPOX class probable F420-dependent enzyme
MDDRIAALAPERYISLTTYRRDGRPVSTPVWFALDGDNLLVWTDRVSGKAKRVRATSRAAVAPCDARGRTKAAAIDAHARVLPPEEFDRANRLLTEKYRRLRPLVDLWTRVTHAVRRKQRPDEIFIEVRLADREATTAR